MIDGDVVATKEIHLFVHVRRFGDRYDWITSTGAESDDLFESPDEAMEDGTYRFG